MEQVQAVLDQISSFVWGPFLLIPLLLLTGLYLTVRLGGLQFRILGHALWLALVRRKENSTTGDVSHYQALATAMAATIGVGNIAGVATAIGIGGPGALFWMWITGLVGMATKYSEGLLGVKYRQVDAKGEQSGGPMYYLTNGIGGFWGKTLGIAFALFGAIAAFGIGNMVQANTAAAQLEATWNISPTWSGLAMAVCAAAVILGGIKSIGRFAAGVVPLMCVLFILANLLVLVVFAERLPDALAMVFTDAFSGTSAAGGFAGSAVILAVQMGVARGIFSNEAGLGTAGIAQAEGRAKDGCDRTDTAIIKMLCMSRKNEDFTEVVRSLNVVPVSIAYEWDPCDQMKARELEQRERTGGYSKQPGEDDSSIAKGLTGYKGRVHIAFGTPLTEDYTDARAVASETDRQILGLYRLYPSNYLAMEQLPDAPAEVDISGWREQFEPAMLAEEQQRFDQRLAACPQEQRLWWLRQYANPVISSLSARHASVNEPRS